MVDRYEAVPDLFLAVLDAFLHLFPLGGRDKAVAVEYAVVLLEILLYRFGFLASAFISRVDILVNVLLAGHIKESTFLSVLFDLPSTCPFL